MIFTSGRRLGPLTLVLASSIAALSLVTGPADAAGPEGQIAWGVHVSLAPTWFERSTTLW
jgi:hypothetical protein